LPHGGTADQHLVAWIVLAVAALADGSSLRQTLRQAHREAGRSETTLDYLPHTSDPTLRAIAVEDAAALVEVGIAAVGILVHELGRPAESDVIASLLIGLPLAATAVGLARPLADLLIGASIPASRLQRACAIVPDVCLTRRRAAGRASVARRGRASQPSGGPR
jgi:divalent metal cation (Fe/Co/Zn/Cd) transporter